MMGIIKIIPRTSRSPVVSLLMLRFPFMSGPPVFKVQNSYYSHDDQYNQAHGAGITEAEI